MHCELCIDYMAVFKCKMCGGDLQIQANVTVCECEYCGTRQTVPTVDDEKKLQLFNRANRLRFNNEFDKAAGVYESIVAEFPEEPESYWGLVLCKYGIPGPGADAGRIFSDDENLSKTEATLKTLSAAKKVQTCDLMLSHLKENIEFMMLDKAGFQRVKKQLSALVRTLDSSTRLLFAQNIAATSTDDGNSMIELLFDVFESDLIEMLDLSDQTRKLIEGSN